MKDRIRMVMDAMQMTQQEFAENIGIAPATISSVFTGRTRPSLGIVEAIKRKFPDVSTDWLMFGAGQMMSSASGDGQATPYDTGAEASADGADAGRGTDADGAAAAGGTVAGGAGASGRGGACVNGGRDVAAADVRADDAAGVDKSVMSFAVKNVDKPQRRIVEIRIFYSDQTWETFVPKE